MAHREAHATVSIGAPIALVFERLTDHEGMSRWPGLGRVRLVKEGTPRNGLGAIREVKTPLLTLQEEVVRYEPPARYDYKIIKGLDVDHHGSVTLAQSGSNVIVAWDISLDGFLPVVSVTARVLGLGLPVAFAHVKRECERLAKGG